MMTINKLPLDIHLNSFILNKVIESIVLYLDV